MCFAVCLGDGTNYCKNHISSGLDFRNAVDQCSLDCNGRDCMAGIHKVSISFKCIQQPEVLCVCVCGGGGGGLSGQMCVH